MTLSITQTPFNANFQCHQKITQGRHTLTYTLNGEEQYKHTYDNTMKQQKVFWACFSSFFTYSNSVRLVSCSITLLETLPSCMPWPRV